MRVNTAVLGVVSISLAAFASPVYAYLDPSTGSMILSAIVGVFATLGLAIKTYWYKIKSFFSGNQQAGQSGHSEQATQAATKAEEQRDKTG